MLSVLACNNQEVGDDLPGGAFTSGPDDDGFFEETTTTDDGGQTSTVGGQDESTGFGELSHDEDILPIWTENCLGSSCHDITEPANGLDLESEGVYDRICNGFHTSTGVSYVDCAGLDPEASYLIHKLHGTQDKVGGSGSPMPPTGLLSDFDLAKIDAWLIGGAIR
ncbi:MAG: hypothetical protein AAF799_15540 [Myxococcota bacterium]